MPPLIIPFFIPHAGCPHQCLFCNQQLISGVRPSAPEMQQIQEQITNWLQRSPNRSTEVAFFGGSFTLLPRQVQDLLLDAVQPFIRQELVQGVRISTRPDGLGDEVLAFLQGRQVNTIEIGVQSLDDTVLRLVGRGHTAEQSLQAIRRVRSAGFSTGAQLLPGLPGDTPDKALQTLRGVMAAGAQFVRIYPATVLQGTGLADLYLSDRYQPPDLVQGVATAARLLDAANKAGVPVIRIGLQADDGLTAPGALLAGCWHPALGQLVRSQLVCDLVCQKARQLPAGSTIRIYCHPQQVSEVVGQGRANLQAWNQAGLLISQVLPDQQLERHQLCLEYLQYKVLCSAITDYIYEE